MTNIKEAIEFAIKNLDLRIEKVQGIIAYNESKLAYAKRDNNKVEVKECTDKIKLYNGILDGYDKAEIKLRNNGKLTDQDIEYILKSLNVRLKLLNKNLKHCTDTVKQEKQALIDKKDKVSVVGGFGVSIKHYDEVSISTIEYCDKRIANITKSLDKCNTAIELFSNMK